MKSPITPARDKSADLKFFNEFGGFVTFLHGDSEGNLRGIHAVRQSLQNQFSISVTDKELIGASELQDTLEEVLGMIRI